MASNTGSKKPAAKTAGKKAVKSPKNLKSAKQANKPAEQPRTQEVSPGMKLFKAAYPWFLAIFALLLVMTFVLDDVGIFGEVINPFLKGLFGGAVFIIPFYLFVISFSHIAKRENKQSAPRSVLCFVNWICISSFLQMVTANPAQRAFWQEKESFFIVFFNNGKKLIGSGALGGTVGTAFESLFGKWATVILSATLFLFSLAYVCGVTPKIIFKKISAYFKSRKAQKLKEKEIQAAALPEKEVKAPAENFEEHTEHHRKFNVDVNTGEVSEHETKRESRVDIAVPDEDRPFDRRNSEPAKQEEEKAAFAAEEEAREAKAREDLEAARQAAAAQQAALAKQVNESAKAEKENVKAPVEEQIVSDTESEEKAPEYIFPPISLLSKGEEGTAGVSSEDIRKTSEKLMKTLESFNVGAKIVNASCGPTVTRYEIQPDFGVKVKSIANLADDIALHLAAPSVRMECPIPGKSAVGIEIPNKSISTVHLRDLISNPEFANSKNKLLVCLGVDIAGNPVYLNIGKMPHLIVAGATGMGKSVCINSMIVSLLYHATPDEVKLILIDPKKIEFADYDSLPHLLVPVVTEPKKAAGTLNWAVNEMESRFSKFAEVGARELSEYNDIIKDDPEREHIPYVVIIIDELADLMMTAPVEVETSICRLAQKARAAGMHLIIGTQRPSVDVITGLIKANFPSRIAFTTASPVDSRTILDIAGAEKLLGRGDMLFSPVGSMKPTRVQGAFIDGKSEVAAVCNFIRGAAGANYNEEIMSLIEKESLLCGDKRGRGAKAGDEISDSDTDSDDPMLLPAIEAVLEAGKASTSMLQTKLKLGYSRASRIIDTLEQRGIIGKFDTAAKKRPVLITPEQFAEMKLNAVSDDNESGESNE